jgi:hypothetical protein
MWALEKYNILTTTHLKIDFLIKVFFFCYFYVSEGRSENKLLITFYYDTLSESYL